MLLLYFIADVSMPFAPGSSSFVLDLESETVAAARTQPRVPQSSVTASPARITTRVATASLPARVSTAGPPRVAWSPPLVRAVSRSDRPASPDAH